MAISPDEVWLIWSRGQHCYAKHAAPAIYVVNGGTKILSSCGDHLSRAVREVALMEDPPAIKVTVWRKP